MQTTKTTRLTVALLAVFTVCSCGQNDKHAFRESTLVRASKSEPKTLDPQKLYDTGSAEICRDIFEGLMRWAPNGNLVPATAESVSVSELGKRFVFKIRPQARWSNGDVVSADDFVRAFRFALAPENASPQAELLLPIVNARRSLDGELPVSQIGVKALAPDVLEIRLETNAPYFLTLLDYPLTFPRHKLASPAQPITNGAYVLAENRPGHSTLLTRNQHYWDRKSVSIQNVRYLHIIQELTQVNLFRAGDLAITSTVPSAVSPKLQEDYPKSFKTTPLLATYYYAFNTQEGPLADAEIRRSLSMVVEQELMTGTLLHDGQLPAYAFVPPYLWTTSAAPNSAIRANKSRQQDDAQAILEKKGYSIENKLRIRLVTNNGDNHSKIALFVANQWSSKLPVEVQIATTEFRVLLDLQKDRGSWDVIRTSWTADFPDPINFLAILASGSPNNIPGYENGRFDSLLSESYNEQDPIKRERLLATAQELLLDQHAALFLYHYVDRRLVSDDLEGFAGNSLGIYRSQDLSLRGQPSL